MQNSTQQLISQLKALADPIRLRLLALCARGECTVSDLTAVVAQSQPRVSQHLKQLCDCGLLQRFRDGQFVYYRVPLGGGEASQRRRLFALLPADEPIFEQDFDKLRERRSADGAYVAEHDDDALRRLHRALIELTVVSPIGDLIDVGSGQGRILKLLASRAQRAVGVDIDSDARQLARAELLLAGVENCSLRDGDMYDLPFVDGEFDTVILDDVLREAEHPLRALKEARRILKPGGRLLLLAQPGADDIRDTVGLEKRFADWCAAAGLRLAPPRRIPRKNPSWVLAVATLSDDKAAAA